MTSAIPGARRGRPPGHRIPSYRMGQLRAAANSGSSLSALGRTLSVTRQRAAQLLLEAGLHDTWEATRRGAVEREHLQRMLGHQRPATRDLLIEAIALGLEVRIKPHTYVVALEGVKLRVLAPRQPKRLPELTPEHPGYYQFQCWVLTALYVLIFPEGGRMFFLPPHPPTAKHQHEYVRRDDPIVGARQAWPTRDEIRAAGRAVAALQRRRRRKAEGTKAA
jgi:hypothetical protein